MRPLVSLFQLREGAAADLGTNQGCFIGEEGERDKARQPHNLSLAGSRGRAIQVGAADEFAQAVLPVIRAIQAAGTTSFASIADVLNERGIKSVRGGKWHVSSVANVLSRTPG